MGGAWTSGAGHNSTQQTLVLVLLVAAGIGLELVVHAHLGISVVYTHFFYLIVAIAGLAFGRRAVLLALFFGGLHLGVTVWLTGNFVLESLLRAAMLCVVALVIGTAVEETTRYRRELEERNAQLQASEQAFQTANRKLNLLSSITRHDIMNQLTALMGRVDLLTEEDCSEQVRTELEQERASIDTIRRLIEFTRDYADLGVGEPEWQRISDAIRSAAYELPTEDESGDLAIYADPMLARVFANLMDNTIRHGGQASRVRVRYWLEGDGDLTLAWEDDGIGVPAGEKERIFERGFGKNTGFGLFLIREILAITGITIAERGEPGEGARFEMRVPSRAFRFDSEAV